MINIYKHILKKKCKDSLIRFELIEDLLVYVCINNKFYISESYFNGIIEHYLNNLIYSPYINTNIDNIYLFCEKIIDTYMDDNLSKFNFILNEFDFSNEIKTWFLKNKLNLFQICKFHLVKEKSSQTTIFSNKFFTIYYTEQIINKDFIFSYCTQSKINIHILLSGKIFYTFYEKCILLNQGEALILTPNNLFQDYKICSADLKLIVIHLEDSFFKKFFIDLSLNHSVKFYFSNSLNDFKKIITPGFISINILFFYELLFSLLKQGGIILDEVDFISNFFEIDLQSLIFYIKKNIKLSTNKIVEILQESYSIKESKLNELVYLNFKTTLNKLILKLKIDSIINDFFYLDTKLSYLIKEYNFKNINSFSYALKTIYNIKLKEFKDIKLQKKS